LVRWTKNQDGKPVTWTKLAIPVLPAGYFFLPFFFFAATRITSIRLWDFLHLVHAKQQFRFWSGMVVEEKSPRWQSFSQRWRKWFFAKKFYAPNLSNTRALACISRIKYFASNTPSEPEFAPVSVKRSSLSEPLNAKCNSTNYGCHK